MDYEAKKKAITGFIAAKKSGDSRLLLEKTAFEDIAMLFVVRSGWSKEMFDALRKLGLDGWNHRDKVKDKQGNGYALIEVVRPSLIRSVLVSYKSSSTDKGSLLLTAEGRSIDCVYECGEELLAQQCSIYQVADCEQGQHEQCLNEGQKNELAMR